MVSTIPPDVPVVNFQKYHLTEIPKSSCLAGTNVSIYYLCVTDDKPFHEMSCFLWIKFSISFIKKKKKRGFVGPRSILWSNCRCLSLLLPTTRKSQCSLSELNVQFHGKGLSHSAAVVWLLTESTRLLLLIVFTAVWLTKLVYYTKNLQKAVTQNIRWPPSIDLNGAKHNMPVPYGFGGDTFRLILLSSALAPSVAVLPSAVVYDEVDSSKYSGRGGGGPSGNTGSTCSPKFTGRSK